MATRIDYLFQEWHQLGGAVLLKARDVNLVTRDAETVLAESTGYCRESGRLTWVVLDWLIQHIEEINPVRLYQITKKMGDLSVLGLLADAAQQRKAHPKFVWLMAHGHKPEKLEPFFQRVQRSPLALKLTQANPLEIFLRWNYLCNELRYL
ncbi:hypothetical protein L0128_19175 [candidate division KSB1 bacterium]|nr:hypothetical protein [candidate division KSB1 bacterium]